MTIQCSPGGGIYFRCRAETSVLLNGIALKEAPIKLGDLLQIGTERLRFELSPVPQKYQQRMELCALGAGVALIILEMCLLSRWN